MKSARVKPHTPSRILHAVKSLYYFLLVWCILMKLSLSENLAIHYSGEEIKKSDMGEACNTYGVEVCTGFLWGNLTERDHLKYHGVNSKLILKRIFKEWVRILGIERGSTRSHSVKNRLWKRLWTCRETHFG
jgi:hypothetical protein